MSVPECRTMGGTVKRAEAAEAGVSAAAEAEEAGCESGRGATMMGRVTLEGSCGTPDDGKEEDE